jgi:hypothetical protein
MEEKIVLTKKEDIIFRSFKWTDEDLHYALQTAQISITTYLNFINILRNNLTYKVEVGNEKYNTTETGY